ncbi:MAG: hypothetical protein ANABAC_3232 [Anaerolineae bacterium]|nr:MAG: hypothetical protein ANABAC_3232 [Anaerolineae bacterium]
MKQRLKLRDWTKKEKSFSGPGNPVKYVILRYGGTSPKLEHTP